ncbi:MAG: iron ABC transporter permease [Bacteroidota bacterium]
MKNFTKNIIRDTSAWSVATLALVLVLAIPYLAFASGLLEGTGHKWQHLTTYFLNKFFVNSIILILGVGFISCLIGIGTAWVVSRYQFWGRTVLSTLLYLPLAIPTYIMAYIYVGLLGYGGTTTKLGQWLGIDTVGYNIMNIYGLIWVLSLSLFPYVYAAARASFSKRPAALLETATLLGASERKYFYSVALPMAKPAIIGGLLLVCMEVLNDYGAAKYFGINTFTTGIFRSWTALRDLQSAVYLAGLLIAFAIVVTLVIRLARGRKSFASEHDSGAKPERISVKGYKHFLVFCIAFLPVLFGLILPIVQLLMWVIPSFDGDSFQRNLVISLQSFSLAAVAGILTVIMSVALLYFSRWNRLPIIKKLPNVSTVGYAIPGAMIGIALFSGGRQLVDFAAESFDWRIGYLIYGGIPILLYAYVFRFLAVAYYPIEATRLRIGTQLAEAAYTLGDKKLKALRRVELPILKPALWAGFLLVFIDTLKELPLTLILKPYDVNTLAIVAYTYADEEQMTKAALPALMLVSLVGLFSFVAMWWQKRASQKTEQ